MMEARAGEGALCDLDHRGMHRQRHRLQQTKGQSQATSGKSVPPPTTASHSPRKTHARIAEQALVDMANALLGRAGLLGGISGSTAGVPPLTSLADLTAAAPALAVAVFEALLQVWGMHVSCVLITSPPSSHSLWCLNAMPLLTHTPTPNSGPAPRRHPASPDTRGLGAQRRRESFLHTHTHRASPLPPLPRPALTPLHLSHTPIHRTTTTTMGAHRWSSGNSGRCSTMTRGERPSFGMT